MKSLVQIEVSEIMNPYLITITPYVSLAEAYEIMVKNKIRRLPVVTGNKELIGIITIKDIFEAKPADIKHTLPLEDVYNYLSTLTVSVGMTGKPVIIYQNSTVGHAAELMLDNKIGGLPVLNTKRELVGLITESDIFRLITKHWRHENYQNSGVHENYEYQKNV